MLQVDLFFYREPEETKKEEEEEVAAVADYGMADYTAVGTIPSEQWSSTIPDTQWAPDTAAAPPVHAVATVDWTTAPPGENLSLASLCCVFLHVYCNF